MNTNAVYNQKKVVRVSYFSEDLFKIPSNIDLENKEQVEEWWIRWNVLYIKLKGIEDAIEIHSEGWEPNVKHPDEQHIESAEEWNLEDDDFDKVDMATGKIEEPKEDGAMLCPQCGNNFEPDGRCFDCECGWFDKAQVWVCEHCGDTLNNEIKECGCGTDSDDEVSDA